jgi:hypothetical protein
MHKLWMLSRFVLPALAIAAFVGHLKLGTGIAGFSSGH